MIKKFLESPYFLVFVTAVLGAISALWASYQQDKSDKETQDALNAKNDQIIALQHEMMKATKDQLEEQRQLKIKSEKIASLYEVIANSQTELTKKTEQIKDLSEKNLTLITGGDNFCRVLVNKIVGIDNYSFAVTNTFESPVYDLELTVENATERHKKLTKNSRDEIVEISMEEAKAIVDSRPKFNVGTLRGMSAQYLQAFPVTEAITYYDINFYARNSVWQQQIAFVKVNGVYRIAYRITKEKVMDNANIRVILEEIINENIPKSYIDKIQWYTLNTETI